MKWIAKTLALVAVLTVSAVAAWAQTAGCTEEFKTATYQKYYDNIKTDQEAAYKAAVEYLTACPNEPADNAYANALRKFKDKYEAALATSKAGNDFKEAISKPTLNYKDILRTGKAYVAVDPNNSTAYLWIGSAGLNDPLLVAEAIQYAPKAIELVESGKPFDPYKSKEIALSSMNELLARASLKTAPADSIPYLIKAAKYNSKNPQIYAELAQAYADGPRAKLTKEYQEKSPNGTETPESKLVLLNLNEVIDRQIDATARAAALTTDAATKKQIMDSLTDDYKFRKGSDTGLTEYVAGILAKPLPEPPTPITALPTPTPTSTPTSTPAPTSAAPPAAGSSTAAKPSTSATSGGSKPAGTATGSQTGGSAKPAASPTPKPRSRRNHRGKN